MLRNFECNSEADILRDDYEPTVLYNPNKPDASLLDRVLKDKCPDYTISHVDASIASMQRTFSADNEDIYTFFTSTVAREMECLFVFDSVNRAISVYDLKNACSKCGHRFDTGTACPECGSENISKKYGENTSVYISADNYAELITVEGNTDNVFNCFKIEGGDDLITATVANINPNGSNYIYQYQQDALADMPENLVQKINEYNALYNNKKPVYEEYTEKMYEAIDEELNLTSEMMPEIAIPTTTAGQELSALTAQITEVAVTNISVISKASADIAVKGMAKVIVDARYDVEIISSSLSDVIANTYRTWTGKFKIVNKGNEEDIAESTSLTSVKISSNHEECLYQKILKALDKDDSLFYSIFEIQDMAVFKTDLKKYCLDRLKSFESSYQTCLDVLIENGVTNENAVFYDVDLYNSMYLPYFERISAIRKEMADREKQISKVQAKKEAYDKLRKDIQKELNFKDYLGDDLWLILSHYLKEDTYSNGNYISKGLNNAELIKKASELYNIACNELYASSKLQFNLTSNLLNLLNIKEFAPFKDKIKLGYWINVRADDVLYQLRLISLSVDYGNLKNISVTFSNAVKVDTVISDTQSILNQAKSMAVSYDYVAHQAKQGNEAQINVQTWIADGLNSSLVQIKNNDNEEITYDNHGLWARSWDDITESYLPEQLRITSNILAFTKDNWLTCSASLGKHAYTYYDKLTNSFANAVDYGLSAQFVQAGYIYGTQIVGGDIYSDNYSPTSGTYINLRDGSFSFAGGKLKYDNNVLSLNGDITANTLNATNSGKISCWNFNNNALYRGKCELGSEGNFYFGVDGISIGNQFVIDKNGNGVFKGEVHATSGEFTGNIKASAISGGTISGTKINNGNNTFQVDENGNLTCNSGHIGGIKITENGLQSDNNIWSIKKDGTAIFQDVKIIGVRNGSAFGSITYDGTTTSGSFGGNSSFGSNTASPFSGTCVTHIQNLAVGQITADTVKATGVFADYATVGSLNAVDAKFENLKVSNFSGSDGVTHNVAWKELHYARGATYGYIDDKKVVTDLSFNKCYILCSGDPIAYNS